MQLFSADAISLADATTSRATKRFRYLDGKNSQNTSFASVLFDFDFREWLEKQTDLKLLTSKLAV